MPDTDTTIAQLRQIVEAFVSERDWRQFHTPKNLAMAMANELGLDLSTAVRDKMVKNAQKYPAAECRGRFGPDDPGPGRAE